MKIGILTVATLLSSSIISSQANASYAQAPNPPSAADMELVCAPLDLDGAGDQYQVIMTEGAVDEGAPTPDLSTIADDENTRVADHSSASSPYGPVTYYGDAGRHGGSVNLFATMGYPGITYAGSFVDQNVDRTQTDTYNFTCQLQHWEVVGSHQEGVPAEGVYVVVAHGSTSSGDEDATRANCDAYTAMGDNAERPDWWGTPVDHAGCHFEGTYATTTTVNDYGWVNSGAATPESLSDGPYFYDVAVYATHVSEPTVSVTETDAAPYFAGDGVVCINPGKKGGTWTAKTGWTKPAQCTTAYFNTAPYISGANVFSSNSLPAF